MSVQPYEKLGAFYLGRLFDEDKDAVSDELLLYDAKDLTTHAVCVGMTGSGKTGLCLSLLEEAAIDGIPALAIDPKGDLGNLLLTFPKLEAGDFRPWVDAGEAARKGQTADEYANKTAELWRQGLASWNQDGERIARLRAAADMAIYTPGSSSGLPLSVLRSFAPPSPALLADADALRERILAAVSGLLALLGLDADPIRSREHILLSRILEEAWQAGRDLDLASIIREIQAPPFKKIGVLDLESFFPGKDRFELAMTLNNLLASPGFAAWMEGEPLAIPGLLWTPEGRPRVSILSIAHLSDAERMFFVTLLLNEVIAWMRTQPGATSLRALLYMDEVFGYFPPTANPPSKTPMLTLLKQARAYGLGVVLATQNPVDLDYKGLSNAGTWFLGRLQTERDKARVLDGLEGIAAVSAGGFERRQLEAVLSGLKSRVFLMNNVHDDRPSLFHTRWAMSYLRGPLTREQIRALMASRREQVTSVEPAAFATSPVSIPKQAESRPVVPPEIREVFLPSGRTIGSEQRIVYRPALLGASRLHFVSRKHDLDQWRSITLLAPLGEKPRRDPWSESDVLSDTASEPRAEPEPAASFADLPLTALQKKSYPGWEKTLADHLYREHSMIVWTCKVLKAVSKPGETQGEFRARLAQLAREARDLKVAKLRQSYAPKLARVEERIRTAEQRVAREQSQYGQQKLQTVISVGATVLGALFGRKLASVGTVGRATTAARGASRMGREKDDIARAEANLAAQQQKLAELEEQFQAKTASIQESYDPAALELDAETIRPRKSDISVDRLVLAWVPWTLGVDGLAMPALA
ncbi:MAG: ATP-binding protein [Acidobacteriota bacterium]|nr:MAG: ATP-binding protein [Acidobacteriota bacterium]